MNRRVAELIGLPPEELVAERDDCGAPTFVLQLAQMALLYAHLGASQHAELEQISRAMLSHPDLVAGEGRFDTELMRRSHGQVLSKGGAEGIQCLSRIGEGLGGSHQGGGRLTPCQAGGCSAYAASTGVAHTHGARRAGRAGAGGEPERQAHCDGCIAVVTSAVSSSTDMYDFQVTAG